MNSFPWTALAAPAAASGGWLLTLYFLRQVFSGRWVPARLYDKEAEAAQHWRQAFEIERDKNRRLVVPMAEGVRELAYTLPSSTGEIPAVRDQEDAESEDRSRSRGRRPRP